MRSKNQIIGLTCILLLMTGIFHLRNNESEENVMIKTAEHLKEDTDVDNEESKILSDVRFNPEPESFAACKVEGISIRSDLKDNDCYFEPLSEQCSPLRTVYMIPNSRGRKIDRVSANLINQTTVSRNSINQNYMIAYIHLNKGGGTTIKKHVLEKYIIDSKTDVCFLIMHIN